MLRDISRNLIFLGLAFFHSLNSIATDLQIKIENAKAIASFSVGIGSEVVIESEDPLIAGPAVFLGKALLPDGSNSFQIFLNKTDHKIYFIDASHFNSKGSNLQPVLNPYEQAGGTCTGYAIYDFLQQKKLSGFTGTGVLATKLANEKGRTTLLVDNINEYYLTPQHRYSIQGILNKYGKELGFNCKTYKSDSYEKTKERILTNLNTGLPVLISFNLGPDMYQSPFALKMYDKGQVKVDSRLWIPRKIGERNSGGHAVVAASSFELDNKLYLVMIDSDWSEPRVWAMDSFLNDKTALDEVELTTCK